jgi:hypothetical protein
MMETDKQIIDTGDTVIHGPTGETWVVAYVQGDRLAWCGWPEGEARLSDCTLKEAATDQKREKLLRQLADMSEDDARRRYARHRLGMRAAHSADQRKGQE